MKDSFTAASPYPRRTNIAGNPVVKLSIGELCTL